MLCQEPWGFTPEQVERLTDWQIENLYAKPAVERAERMARDVGEPTAAAATPAPPPAPPPTPPRRPARENRPDFEPGTDGHRRQCISAFMNVQGLSRKRAEAQYARQLAEWQTQQGEK